MSNSIARKPNTTPAVVDEDEDIANILAESEGSVRYLKFKKGEYFVGETEVALNTEYRAYCRDRRKGWVKFVDNKKVEDCTRRVGDKSVPIIKRDERHKLDDLDESQWPLVDGEPKDPWAYQYYLPLESIESGNLFMFVSGSAGGAIAVDDLCDKWIRNNLAGSAKKGRPTVALRVDTFDTKRFKKTPRPDFVIVGWENDNGDTVVMMSPPSFDGPGPDDEILP